jgi:hypothetical protein
VRVAPAAAPPAENTSAPWAALLAEPLEAGAFTWVMGAEGVLVPVATGNGEAASTPRGARFRARVASRLLGR